MLLTEESPTVDEVLGYVIEDVELHSGQSLLKLDVVVGNLRFISECHINQVMIDDIMGMEVRPYGYQSPTKVDTNNNEWKHNWKNRFLHNSLHKFDSEILSEVCGGMFGPHQFDIIKDFNPEKLSQMFIEAGGTYRRLVEKYVECDGYGDHFSCDGEATLMDGVYIFKWMSLDDYVYRNSPEYYPDIMDKINR